MAPTVPLRAVLPAQFPAHTLSDLLTDPHDLENDLHLLLNWLQPYYLSQQPPAEPSVRVRAAARRCLKERSVHHEFVRLLLNAIAAQFRVHFQPVAQGQPFAVVVEQVAALRALYSRQLSLLSLCAGATHLFSRGLNALFLSYLDQPAFLARLDASLHEMLNAPAAASLQPAQHSSKRTSHESKHTSSLDVKHPSSHDPKHTSSYDPKHTSHDPTTSSPSPAHQKQFSPLKPLAAVGLGPHIQDVVVRVTSARIASHLAAVCACVWDRPLVESVHEWVRIELFPTFASGCVDSAFSSSHELVAIANDELVSLRIHEIYRMVCSFPASATALAELHSCLGPGNASFTSHTHHRSKLVQTFTNACNVHLLHSGSNTVQIAAMYIKTIRSFLVVDPTGVLLDKVARPIRRYLKTRPDLVSYVVKGMLDTNTATNPLVELAAELFKAHAPTEPQVDDLSDVNWCPDPIDALPDFKKGKVSDVVDALTSIFPSPTVVTDELTRLFGDRLLQWDTYPVEEIMSYVELLKTRFGAGEFATLDVMLKDVRESRATNEQIAAGRFSLTVLSKMYWPTVVDQLPENESFNIPAQADFEAYSAAYKSVKRGRGLKLLPSLGTVTLDLDFGRTVRSFTVTPAQATVVELFHEDSDEMSIQTIAQASGMTVYQASQAIKLWVQEGVLSENGQRYRVIE